MRLAVTRELLDLLLPRGCLGCGERIPPEEPAGGVCGRCLTLLRPPPFPRCPRCDFPLGTAHPTGEPCPECQGWPPFLASARAAVVMEAPADALVHALKYSGWKDLAEGMGRRMARLRSPAKPGTPVVPVPTTPGRRRMRGYNQAALLAEAVARERGAPYVPALERPSGRTQVRLGPLARRRNVQSAFQVGMDVDSHTLGTEVILVDDVLTTGATAQAAAWTLARSGVEAVHLLVFARALPFGERGRGRP